MNKLKLTFLSIALLLFVASCGDSGEAETQDVATNETEQTDTAEQPEETPEAETQPLPEGDLYEVDLEESVVNWRGTKKVMGAHFGTIKLKSGALVMDDNGLVGGQFDIDMATVSAEDLADAPDKKGQLEGHLTSADFFDVEQFPTASFTITSVAALEPAEDGDPTHDLTGDLTIKGKTNSITFPVVFNFNADTKYIDAGAEFQIDRTKWDVIYGSEGSFADLAKDKIINDMIEFGVVIRANKVSG